MNKNETILEQFRNIVPGVTPINKLRKRKIYVERDLGNETKCTTFLKEIVFKHLLGFVGDQTIQNSQLRIAALYPTSIGIENLIEHSLAQVGSYEFVNEKYRDFNDEDNSDSKTGSVNVKTKKVEISSIENKIGALRISVFNPFTQSVDYFFIPYDDWKNTLAVNCYGVNKTGKLRLVMQWNEERDSYNKFDPWRLTTFQELAKMTVAKFRQIQLNTVSLGVDSDPLTKNPATQQIATPCNQESELTQSQDSVEIQPISPYAIS